MLVPCMPFQSCLMFLSKARAFPSANIRLGCWGLSRTNALAYHAYSSMIYKKFCYIDTFGQCYKTFFSSYFMNKPNKLQCLSLTGLQPSLIFALRKGPALDQTGKASQLKNYPAYLSIHKLRKKGFITFAKMSFGKTFFPTLNRQKQQEHLSF